MTKTEAINEFNSLYIEVFDENNNVKACGRDLCKKLINIANLIDDTRSHGDLKDGFMDVNSIIDLHKSIKNNSVII